MSNLEDAERLRALVASSSEMVVVVTTGGVIRAESPSVGKALGRQPGGLVGRSAFELVHPNDAAEVIDRFTRSIRKGSCEDALELRLRRSDGTWGRYELQIPDRSPELGADELIIRGRDVTALRRAESGEHRLATILDATPEFVGTLDPNGRVLYLNRAGRRMLDLSPDYDVSALNFPDLYSQAETERMLRDGLPTALATGIWSGETALITETGSEVPVAQVMLAHKSEDGAVEFVSVIARDIREQKQAEAALRRSEEHYRSLIENAQDVVHIMDRDGTIRYISPSVERVLGYAPEFLVGTSAFDIIHIDDVKRVENAFSRRVSESGPGDLIEIRLRHAHGHWRNFEMQANNLFHDAAVGGIVINSRDITQRVEAESALKESQEQLLQSQKMEAVGRLAGGIAHDFNNLLTAIKGFTELLLLDFDSDDPRRSFASEIQGAAGRAAGLTRQLLAFSRKQVLQPKVLDLNVVVAEMENMLRRLIGEDFTLSTKLADGLGRVRADPGQVEQVVLNLAVNARDAMPGGGELTVQTSEVELTADGALPSDLAPGPYVVLSVSDTGSGIDEATQAHIFEPFYTTKEQGKGTGLGLSTVYGIVKQSGGSVMLESEIGVGSTFRIYLPRVEDELEVAPQRDDGGPVEGNETILLVEDELAVRALVRRVLTRYGYNVMEAENGPAAINLIRKDASPVDLLLTDVVMPGMSGRELGEQVFATHPAAKILYMSGYTDEAIVHHGVLEPGTAFLEKPFTPDILLRKVREVLDTDLTG
ncbi:MAG TPA: PAS domain S-box protein [Longimicrobiaceae bacterium]|nr:PAS domain S-box protein [Longimicrobiaceae bacterium]